MLEYRIIVDDELIIIDFGHCGLERVNWWKNMLTREGKSFTLLSRSQPYHSWGSADD
jgi:hypothetical protein